MTARKGQLQMERLLARMACSARVAFHFSVLLVVALLPFPPHSNGLLDLTESEAPVERDESSEEATVHVQAGKRVGHNESGLLLSVSGHRLRLLTTGTAGAPQSGHRLPNNLMAPLRC
jgi:hypothetical protein